ncbi:MAG TPA: hypothetical protein VFJ45_11030 [bacterium]|nr:hypothetical protein [bacterium]
MKGVAMLWIDESIIELGEGAETVCDLHSVETRLRSPGWNTAERLMNYGSNLAWARLSEYTDLLTDHQLMPLTKKRRHKDLKPTREVGGG